MTVRSGWWGSAAWKVPLALLLGVGLCELGLRLVAGGTELQRSRPEAAALGPGGRTVVCVGDSNTYGTNEDVEDTYPRRLAQLLDERVPGGPHRVVNLGVPGHGAHQVAQALPDVLERERPDLVLVLAGVNDLWRFDESASVPPWYEGLRLVKLARLLAPRFGIGPGDEAPELDGEGRPHWSGRTLRPSDLEVREEGLCERIAWAVKVVREVCAASAAEPVVLTYAWDRTSYAQANECLRRAADAAGATLVDCAARLAPYRERYPRDEMFWPDGHPRALGYELFARAALRGLVEAGLVEEDPERGGGPGGALDAELATRHWADARARLRVERRGEDGRPDVLVEVEGEEAGRRYQVLVSLAAGDAERAELGGRVLPVLDDELFRSSFRGGLLAGTFDAQGRARVALGNLAALAERLGGSGAAVRVAVAVLDRRDDGRIARLLPAVEAPAADLR